MNKIGVFAIIFNNQKEVLLCHRRDYDLWNLPGGGLEENESPWEGVIREVKEETGLKVKVDKLQGVYYKPEQNEIVFSFLCSIVDGKVCVNDEADKIDFFRYSEIPNNTSLKQKERIYDAIHNLKNKKIILKNQSGPTSLELIKNTNTKN